MAEVRISPRGSCTLATCPTHREGKPAALMRMVSRTPQALSCCTALFSSNLRVNVNISDAQRSLAPATNYSSVQRPNSFVRSQVDKWEKETFKSWSRDHNGKLCVTAGKGQLAVKIQSRATDIICSSHHKPIRNTTGHIFKNPELLSTFPILIEWLGLMSCSHNSLVHHI